MDKLVGIIREEARRLFPKSFEYPSPPIDTEPAPTDDAVILADVIFKDSPAKTAHGLVRYSRKYRIRAVIDSTRAGHSADEFVHEAVEGIPIVSSVGEAMELIRGQDTDAAGETGGGVYEKVYLINGASPVGGRLPAQFRSHILEALELGMDIVNTLHEDLMSDPEIAKAAKEAGATIHETRREPPFEELHKFSNSAGDLPCYRIAMMGTDSCIGKRTTGVRLWRALNEAGIRTSFVATGQTGLLQGFPGVPLDAIRGDYVVGELEHAILDTYQKEKPLVLMVEGQGALSHPVYVMGSHAILSALKPHGVVLVHDPARTYRNYGSGTLNLPMPIVGEERQLIESHGVKVLMTVVRN
jgi:uncharacterized NAD-dependent epimerase/dehydratase family protein